MNWSWWCTSSLTPWEWEVTLYPGVWILIAALGFTYFRLARGKGLRSAERNYFLLGLLALWVASDWPLGPLGAGYLAAAHMTQFVLYAFVAVPLLLRGTPEWMLRRILARLRLYRFTKWVSGSLLISGIAYNVLLVVSHAPITVDNLRASQFGSFAMDMVWILIGLLLWVPVISPIPEFRAKNYLMRILYLFITTSVIAVIPASALTFGDFPLYTTYELAPRVFDLTALEDQQIAGLIMKVATIPLTWFAIAVMWFRWARQEGVPTTQRVES
jgi:putative membrane protein